MPVNSFENYPMSWKPSLSGMKPPIYKALAKQLENDIKNGLLHPGDLLPPQRELADFLDLNLSTISKAFKLCSQKGLISASIGRGTYISSDVQVNSTLLDPQEAAGLIEMGAIHPAYEFNIYIQEMMRTLLKNKSSLNFLEYTYSSGSLYQKNTGVKWLSYAGVKSSVNQILLANGGQNALCAVLSSLFHAGDKIGTDPLIFAGVKTLAKMLGIQLVPIPWTDGEMSCDSLEQYCKTEGLKGIYMIPDFQNPTTHTLSLERRQMISDIAQRYHLIIIEDAINSLLAETPPTAMATLIPEQTIYISSLSKVICPGIQIAFIHTPLAYKSQLESGLYNINLMTSPLNAQVACMLIHSPACRQILSKRRQMTIARNHMVDTILGDYHPAGSPECNFRFLSLPKGLEGKSFERCAQDAGVQVYCGERFAIGSILVPPSIRLSITSPRTLEDLETGLTILRDLLKN